MYKLQVRVCSGIHLVDKDFRECKRPYCDVKVGKQKYSTKIAVGSDPTWNETFTFSVNDPYSEDITLDVCDSASNRSDCVGFCTYPLNQLTRGINHSQLIPVKNAPYGEIHLELKAIDFGSTPLRNEGRKGLSSEKFLLPRIETSGPPRPAHDLFTAANSPIPGNSPLASLRYMHSPTQYSPSFQLGRNRNCTTPNQQQYNW